MQTSYEIVFISPKLVFIVVCKMYGYRVVDFFSLVNFACLNGRRDNNRFSNYTEERTGVSSNRKRAEWRPELLTINKKMATLPCLDILRRGGCYGIQTITETLCCSHALCLFGIFQLFTLRRHIIGTVLQH